MDCVYRQRRAKRERLNGTVRRSAVNVNINHVGVIMGLTKRGKKIRVAWRKFTGSRSEYQCPTCKIVYVGAVVRNTLSFVCDCGQKLIVDEDKYETKVKIKGKSI